MSFTHTRFLGSRSLVLGATVLCFGLTAAACKKKGCPPGHTEYSGYCLATTPQEAAGAAADAAAGVGGSSAGEGGSDASVAGMDAVETGADAGASAADGGGGSGGAGAAGDSAEMSGGGDAGASGSGGDDAPGEMRPDCFPSAEYCDSKDNDCDGQADEALTRPCGPPSRGQCKSGTETCVDGSWSACSGALEGSAEICDAERNDENCDGSANEGCACSAGDQKPCEASEGICVAGQQYCVDGTWGSCEGSSAMTMEVCDAAERDEDCDGMINEGCECTEAQTDRCDTGRRGACMAGIKMCAGGVWGECILTVAPSAEVCGEDEVDEDCDGTVDEGCCRDGEQRNCTTDREGVCQEGTERCSNGAWGACESKVEASEERCDGQDNDCNGMSDDGEPCPNGQRCDGRRCVGCTRATESTDCPNTDPCRRNRCNDQGACVADRRPDGTECETDDGAGMCTAGECVPEVQASEDDVVCYAHAANQSERSQATTAITFRQAPVGLQACVPNGGPEGCGDWFGLCETRSTRVPIAWELYDDGHTQVVPARSIAHWAPMEAYASETQIEPRKWFGAPKTEDGRVVECRLFDDPNRPLAGTFREFYLAVGGRVCANETTCALSFGLCEVTESR